jgi:PhnB protein
MKTPDTYPPLIPAFAVHDAAQAIEFYKAAFGATELYRLIDPESGKIGHTELLLNGSLIMFSDEYPEHNKTPRLLGGTTMTLCLMVEDVDAIVERATVAGATVTKPPCDQFYGHRSATVRDPFGHEWMIQHEIEKVSPEEMQKRWDAMVKAGETGCAAADK